MQLLVTLIATLGTLAGVALGAALTARSQASVLARQEAGQSRQERQRVFAAFIAAAREWRANVMSSEARIVEGSTISRSRHADGNGADVGVLRIRGELRLIAHSPTTIACADDVICAVRRLAEARGSHVAGQVPVPIVECCRSTEAEFITAARAELGSPALPGLAADQEH